MPETRWVTINRQVPNGGFPPGIMLTDDPYLSPPSNAPLDWGPPNGGLPPHGPGWGPPPPPYRPPPTGPIPYFGRMAPPTVFRAPPASEPFPVFAPCPTPVYPYSQCPPYEPPGQYVDGHIMEGNGWSYITPADDTTICFVNNGVRPCDWPNGECTQKFGFSKHKVPCSMTVRELIKQLGCPDGETKGLTEVRESGSGQWLALDSFTQGGEASKQTLAQVGWTKERGEMNPVWLAVKR